MDTRAQAQFIEIISRSPAQPRKATPLLFVHGAFAGAWCWDEHFLGFFAEHGYAAHAVSLRGHGGSWGHDNIDWWSIQDYVEDVRRAVAELEVAPVLIGHSMGGFVVQKYLEQAAVPAAVLMCSVPPQGLLGSSLQMAFSRPDLMGDLNHLLGGGQVASHILEQALFAQDVEPERLARYYAHMQKESQRAVWDMSLFNLPLLLHMKRPPLHIIGAEKDALVPEAQVRMTASTYGLAPHIFPDMGHGLMLEQDWEKVARHLLAWLDAQVG
jgi:non-heme chloroperoxidase